MKKAFKLIIVLTIISVFSGGVLAAAYNLTSPKMLEIAQKNEKEAIFEVMPDIESYKKYPNEEGLVIYEGLDGANNVIGIAYVAEGAGFQGKVKLMVGINLNANKISGYKVLEHQETPGLGARISEDSFKDQFADKSISDSFAVKDDVDAITGATVSSKAVSDLLKTTVEKTLKVYGGEG